VDSFLQVSPRPKLHIIVKYLERFLKCFIFKKGQVHLLCNEMLEHNTDYIATVYLTKRTEEMWKHKEVTSLSDGLSIYLYSREEKEAKGLGGNEGNVFYAFQSKRKRGIYAFLSTCRLADVVLRPAVHFGTAKRLCTSLKLLGCSQKAVPAKTASR
jgi:hypothetical protein